MSATEGQESRRRLSCPTGSRTWATSTPPGRHIHIHQGYDHPFQKGKIIEKAEKEVKKIDDQYKGGLITDGEKYNKAVDIWAQSTEQIAGEMMKEMALRRWRVRTARRSGQKASTPFI